MGVAVEGWRGLARAAAGAQTLTRRGTVRGPSDGFGLAAISRAGCPDAPGVSNACLAEERLVHVHRRFEAVLAQVHHLAHLLEDERLAWLIALHLETGRVVTPVLHALQPVEDRLEDEATVLQPASAPPLRARPHAPARRGRRHRQRFHTSRLLTSGQSAGSRTEHTVCPSACPSARFIQPNLPRPPGYGTAPGPSSAAQPTRRTCLERAKRVTVTRSHPDQAGEPPPADSAGSNSAGTGLTK